uniref:Transmembrane protein n=1 Tax=Chromera velia CCMP2878 TaxID=1169474 RepID=A0A0G4HW82_9ALVE|eukprot:Cvel_9006.t1-p1 / transcript=Cvel_9006.t1 / gene=Cvel_9006 / organism=Chromera_velia_CCMP2878 / gene_product=hypothetical protein / transcript_product=hypothetical protein / location=Cvel_scaffold509:79049-80727(+) / protein_length=240 / sequence_SO=supercontig / SO=protein_coding / is_pseudo=false
MRCILSYSQPIESLEIPFLATNFPFLVGATVLALLGFFRESVALMICGLVSLVFHFWQCVDGQGSCRVQFCLVGDFLACGLMGAVTVGAQVSPAPAAPRCTHRNEQEEAEAQERVWTLTPSSEATDTLPMPPSDVDDTEDHGAVETESEIETETETERRADLPLLQAPSFCQGKEKEEENEEEEFAEGEESLPLSLSLSLSVPLCAVCGGTLGISAVHGDSQTSIASAATTATAAASPRD